MKVEYVPKGWEGREPSFDGSLVIDLPRYHEVLGIIEKHGYVAGPDGKVEANSKAGVSMMREVLRGLDDRVSDLKLEHKSGKKPESLEEVEFLEGGTDLMNELASLVLKVVNGSSMGED